MILILRARGGFLLFPIGDRRCNRTRASVGNAGGNARPSLTNATLAASRLLARNLGLEDRVVVHQHHGLVCTFQRKAYISTPNSAAMPTKAPSTAMISNTSRSRSLSRNSNTSPQDCRQRTRIFDPRQR